MTKFTEFYNRQKNVIKSSISKRLGSSIPITEERDAFYKGELFKKYDIVESEGKQYTILEQASNYYQVVDAEGNLSRKFPKQLKKVGHSMTSLTETTFHGYTVKTEEAWAHINKYFFDEAIDCDDVGILKTVKQLDEQMDNSSYKSKDKLTVAKIIADAVGVPHDVVSTPENLVAAAIRKAKKDPKLVKNKEILANMLQIAREVGIKITDETFEVKEATDWSPGAKETIKKDRVQSLKNLIVSYQSKKNFKKVAELQKELDGLLKESEELEEALTYKQVHTSWSVEPKSKNEFNKRFKKEEEAEARAHAEKTGGKLRKIDQRGHVIKANAVHESEQLDEISDTKKVEYIHAARKSIKKLDAEGNDEKRDQRSVTANKTYSSISKDVKKKAFGDMRESEELDEHIVKTDSGYRLVSKSTGKNLGDFKTKEEAEKHEREVQFFKHQNESIEVTEGEVKQFPKKHPGDLSNVTACHKCDGPLQGGTYMGHRVKVCQACMQVYLPPNAGIDKNGTKIKESEELDEMDNRTPSGDRREQRSNTAKEKSKREKEYQDNLQLAGPIVRKKLGLPEPVKESIEESERHPSGYVVGQVVQTPYGQAYIKHFDDEKHVTVTMAQGRVTRKFRIDDLDDPSDADMYESVELDEAGLSRKTIDSYLEKSKESKPTTVHKAIKRFAGQERAHDRVHKDEMEQMRKRLSLKEMRAKLSEELSTTQKVDKANDTPDADVEAKPNQLPHGHTLHPSNEIHRKQLIRKVRGDD